MANPKYNWEEIEQDYVTGKLTYRELADNYKVSESRIGVVGGKRNWAKKRKEYREGLNKKAIDEAKKTKSLEKARFDELTIRACDAVAASMAALATGEYNAGALSPKKSEGILSATQRAQDIKYRALGVPPPKSAQTLEAEEAFRHYQEKLAEAMARLSETGTVIKPSNGNGRPSLNPNDFIEIEITEPTQEPSKN